MLPFAAGGPVAPFSPFTLLRFGIPNDQDVFTSRTPMVVATANTHETLPLPPSSSNPYALKLLAQHNSPNFSLRLK